MQSPTYIDILMHNHPVTNLAPMLHPHAQSSSHQLSSHVAFTCTKAPIAQPDSPQPPELSLHNQTVPSLPSSLHNQTVPSLPIHNQTVPSLQMHSSQSPNPQPGSSQPPTLCLTSACTIRKLEAPVQTTAIFCSFYTV